MSLTITIGGVDVTSKVAPNSFALQNAIGQRDTFSLSLVSKDGSYVPAMGAPVVVTHSALGTMFGGSVRRVQTELRGETVIVTGTQCASWEQIFDRRLVGEQKVFTDTPAGDVFQYIFDNWLTFENLTASIVAAGPNISITLDWCTVREAFDQICQLASDTSSTYMWDCTPTKVTRFYSQASFPAPFNVTEDRTDILRNITVTRTFDQYANRIFVRLGQFITDARENTYHPDGVQSSLVFELPIAKTPTVTVNGVEQTVGVRDVDSGRQCYWQDGSAEVAFTTAPPLGSVVVITAQGYQSTVVDAGQNDDEVTERGTIEDNSGWYIKLIESSTPGTSADAVAIGRAYLDRFSRLPYAVEYITTYGGIRAGQYQNIALTKFGPDFSAVFIIESSTLVQENSLWFWKVRAINGALANNWLTRLRNIASGGNTGVSGGAASVTPSDTLTFTIVNGTCTPTLPGAGTNGSPFQLPSGEQTIDVTATTQDVYMALPSAATMVGKSVTLNLAGASTRNGILRLSSGDNIDGSTSDYVLSEPGAVVLKGVSSSRWIVASQAGTTAAPAAPDAPNVSFASATATLRTVNHLTEFSFNGTINLPTADGNYTHLKRIDVVAYGPSNKSFPVASLYAAQFSGSTITFAGGLSTPFSGSSLETWTLKAWCINDDDKATASPASTNVTVTPPSITGLTGTDDTADRWKDSPNNSVYAPQQVAITCGAMTFTLWIFDGTRNNWQGWYTVSGNQTFKIGLKGSKEVIFAPPANATWTIKAAPGAWEGSDADGWRCQDLGLTPRAIASVPGIFSSAGYTVAGMAKPLATEITALTIPAGAGGTYPYDRLADDGGTPVHVAYIPSMTYDDTGCGVNSAFVTLTVTDLDAAGNPVSAEQKYGVRPVIGKAGQNWGDLIRSYGSDGGDYPRTGVISKVRLKQWLGSRKNADDNAWTDSTTYTLQTTTDVVLAVGGAVPGPTTKGVYRSVTTGLPVVAGADDPANLIVNPRAEDGAVGWDVLDGSYSVVGGGVTGNCFQLTGNNAHIYQTIASRAGKRYYFAGKFNPAAWGFQVTLTVWYLDASFGLISQEYQSITTAAWGWQDISITTNAAPTGTVYARFFLGGTSMGSNIVQFDDVQLIEQVSTGDGMEPDGRGGAKVKPGATIDFDGSGRAVVKQGTLTEAYIVGGGLGTDPTKWASTSTYVGVYYGLPAVTGAPNTIINTGENPYRMYDKIGGSWVARKTQPGDLIAGTITALVNLTSPTISGGSLTITNGTLTISIDGSNSVRVYDSGTGWTSQIYSSGMQIYGGNAKTTVTPFGVSSLISGVGASMTSGGYTANGATGVTGTFPYVKPGGTSGNIIITGGIITAVS